MNNNLTTVGWREWCSLPELSLKKIKVKIDTGAKTSCLHAFNVEPFIKNDQRWVRFGIHPKQRSIKTEIFCEAKVIDQRNVTDSGGHTEKRYVISTQIILGAEQWPIEITLTNRDNMRFRMLLGRTAMKNKIIVNPGASYLLKLPKEN